MSFTCIWSRSQFFGTEASVSNRNTGVIISVWTEEIIFNQF